MKSKIPDQPPSASLIVTCYNKPEQLRVVLTSALDQTVLPREIVVADDGSKDDVRSLIRELRASSPIPIVHVWQPDEGFRLNRSRNNALALATGDYVVMLDGDCFVNRFFIEDHVGQARIDQYVGGRRVHIDPSRREYVLRTGDLRINFFSRGKSKSTYAIRSHWLSKLFSTRGSAYSEDFEKIAGANMAFWRADAERVNGFNEVFVGYGGDDRDFVQRLTRSGLESYRLRHLAIAYHFKHQDRQREVRDDFEARLAASLEPNGYRVKDEFGLTRAYDDPTLRVER